MIETAVSEHPQGRLSRLARQLGDLHERFPIPATGVRLFVLVVLSGMFAILSPYFLLPQNLTNVTINVCMAGVVACPLTLLMVARQIDISVGSAVSWSAVVFAVSLPVLGLPLALLAGFAGALAVTAINGFAVTVIGINSLIVTLATLSIFRGAARLLAGGQTVPVHDFDFIGYTRVFDILPFPVLILILVVAAYYFLMRFTVYGRHMYALGANPRAARLAGVKTSRNLLVAFLMVSVGVTLASLISVSQLGTTPVDLGSGLELIAITGIILGGASLSGGKGSVLGTMSALLILAVLDNGMTLMNVYAFWQDVVRGSVLLAAVTVDQLRVRLGDAEDGNE